MSEDGEAQSRLERTIAETRDDVIGLKSGYAGIQRDMVELKSAVVQLTARFEEGRKPNLPLLGLMFGQLPIVVVLGTFIMSSYTTSAVAPLQASVAQLQATQHGNSTLLEQVNTMANASQQSDANSRTDREQLNNRVRALEQTSTTEAKQTAIELAKLNVSLSEIETQFRKDADMNNVRFAHDERDKAMIWNSSHPGGPPWPTEPFFYPDSHKQ